MTKSNRQRVTAVMDLLTEGLQPYVERQYRRVYGPRWVTEAGNATRRDLIETLDGKSAEGWDTKSLLDAIQFRWNDVFGNSLGQNERNLVGLLRDLRHAWAHNEPFDTDRTYRVLDYAEQLLTSLGAEQVGDIKGEKQELLRDRYSEQRRSVTRRTSTSTIEGQPLGNLQPWREVIVPHPDVVNRTFNQAEFAADLGQVAKGEGSDEYRKPRDFFARTYITAGIHDLLVNALTRLSGGGGDPVVKLQTNFGGGKTHSMLALYHLVSGEPPAALPGLESVLSAAGIHTLPPVRWAVIAGQAYGPARVRTKPDGIDVHTLWGELAWQLLGAEGYRLVAESDRSGTSPGSDALVELFRAAGPSLILIDEWITFIRQTWDDRALPAGSFEANLTFAQALTEAARQASDVLLVASLPSSDIEVGGPAGREALTRLEHTFGRVEAVWRAASTEEGFEIVRRRLFEPLVDARKHAERDAVIRGFIDLYKASKQDFPNGTSDGPYEERMRAAYPIHPELFDRLFQDWSQLERFQRTRGVLRLMAKVIASLWESNDRSLLILPANVPIADFDVRGELTRLLDDNWQPVIEKDVDGEHALPVEIDRENASQLGRYSATRRVARTVFLGSAPIEGATNRGIDDRHLRLGVVQPGESVATFGDALRRLENRATYLYADTGRHWYARTPTVNRTAQDRAAQLRRDEVLEEIRRRLRKAATSRAQFARVHAAPRTSSDVPDDDEVRLVILDPDHVHNGRAAEESLARAAAREILDTRGNSPRLHKNMLAFLAANASQLEILEQGTREYLAWKSIEADHESLNLDPHQRKQASTKLTQADNAVEQRLPEAYNVLLAPTQPDPTGPVAWPESRLQSQGTLAERAARKLINDGAMIVDTYGYTLLRADLDRIPLWRGDDISVRELWELHAKYLYLPRLRDSRVLLETVRAGTNQMLWHTESWAYAQRKDENGRYHGLTYQRDTSVAMDGSSLIVKPAAAQRQIDADAAARAAITGGEVDGGQPGGGTYSDGDSTVVDPKPPVIHEAKPRRFHGSVAIDPQRVSTSAGQIGDEIIQHLAGLIGSNVRVTLEIEADIPDGASEQVVRTVTENARTLRFRSHGFEKE